MDTPIWLISESYEMVCKSVWKEKLSPRSGYGLLPSSEIDWDRIRWLRPNQGWPLEVPLKPWKGRPGKNYSISFRSYAQGRQQMQAESIGGFCFFEQFPWGLLEEVMRGCREYAFAGNKLCEFTPVDPGLSGELREMEELNELPEGWAIYRANTRCAMEAGHVSEQWYNQFFGMIPQSMRRVRERGLWGGFEGAVYPEFDTALHCVGDEWDIPPGWFHRRTIDWGFGLDNAFCCLWYCKNGAGEIVVYDEYYSTDTRLTVIEHLKNIEDKHSWPRGNPHYGVTFADPSNINCHRIASQFSTYAPGYESINLQAANNDVFGGIEYMKWLLQLDPALALGDGKARPRLKIHRKRCPNLVRQMMSYRWMKSAGTVDAKPAPVKADDHACTVATMPVLTKQGWRPIIEIRSGDLVYSRHGWTKVLTGATRTGNDRELVRVIIDGGEDLICTPEHRLLTENGWVKASQAEGQLLQTLPEASVVPGIESRGLSIEELSGADTQTASISRHGTSRSASEGHQKNCIFTGLSTKTFADLFLMDSTSIMMMEIKPTMTQATLSRSRHHSMHSSMGINQLPQCKLPSNSIDRQILRSMRESYPQQQRRHASIGSHHAQSSLNVRCAASSSERRTSDSMRDGYALKHANGRHWLSLIGNVAFADARSKFRHEEHTGSIVLGSARRIIAVQPAGRDDVFCIATESGSMVWTGGAIVSNCDALRYGPWSEACQSGVTPQTIARLHTPQKHGVQITSSRLNRADITRNRR